MPKKSMTVLDTETKGIKRRPEYPPKPVGISIIYPGKRPQYFAWDHPEGNNCEEWQVRERIKDIERSNTDMLFHNAKFDIDVMQTWLGMGEVDWRRVHDTMYLLFLFEPHAKSLSLKPASERILGMPPEEQDHVKDWVLRNKRAIELKYGETFKPSEWGAHISEAPVKIVAPYANGDTARTKKLYDFLMPEVKKLGMEEAYDRERQLMPIMLENERVGMRVDLVRLNSDIIVYSKALTKADDWLRKKLKVPGLNVDSDAEVAKALKARGIVTDFVQTPTGKDSVSKKNLTFDMFKDIHVFRALGYRNRLMTSLGTFMQPWALLAGKNKGMIHTNWNQVRSTDHGSVGARTGRMSCSPNFMNIPTDWYDKGDDYSHPKNIDLPMLPMIRSYVTGDGRGQVFGGRDYNQQELRILAHFEDDVLMAEYQANPMLDVHDFVRTAVTSIIGRDVGRKAIKILNFGTIYGMGMGKLAEGMGVDVDTAKQVNAARRSAMPGLKSLEQGIKDGARSTEHAPDGLPIRTWGGRLYYKEPSITFQGRRIDFGYKLLNYLIQGSAADCTKQAVINYHEIKKHGRFLAQVHDEVNINAPSKAMKGELLLLRDAMLDVKFDVPMLSEPYYGKSWGEVVKYKEKP